jgi:thioredoxin reductase (NADPH)
MSQDATATAAAPRPVLLTVDDDPSVSRAIARDLRREYGDRYRVVRAESGAEALDALRELALRGDRVAVLLADHRMPAMTGIEFLEQAMDLFPRARRVLLTAYADTDAAISAINTVDLDHYLLKPWSPPEQLLYPVVDALLEAWAASGDAPTDLVRLVGHRWSAPSHEVREFLTRNGVPYTWLPADEAEGARLLAAGGHGPDDLPLLLTTDGEPLVAPTLAQVAERVGLLSAPVGDFYDVVVVGGGPAGLGAAVYAASEGLRTVLVESRATGGQAGQSSRIENYLGFPDGVSGAALTDRARRQAVRFGTEVMTGRAVVGLLAHGARRTAVFDDGSSLQAHCVVLATGVQYRLLQAEGVEAFTGAGVYYGAALTEASACAGEVVHVVGAANSAGQAAVNLARHAAKVVLLVRGSSLTSSMSHYLIAQIAAIPTIEVRPCTEVVAAEGEGHLQRITLRHLPTGTLEQVDTAHLFVFIGAEPGTQWLDGVLARDERGFVLAGPELLRDGARPGGWPLARDPWPLETSLPGVFAAGDVRAASVKRVASAVGEGALAVTLVHQYLERL